MNIKQADTQDAAAILDLQKLAYRSEATLYDHPTIPPLTQTLDQLQAEFAMHLFLKAVVDDAVVGSVRARVVHGTCQVGRLIVHPAMQRRGIGTTLIHNIEHLHPLAERFELFTGSRSDGNIRLYQRLGYGIYKTEALNERVTLVYMEKYAAR